MDSFVSDTPLLVDGINPFPPVLDTLFGVSFSFPSYLLLSRASISSNPVGSLFTLVSAVAMDQYSEKDVNVDTSSDDKSLEKGQYGPSPGMWYTKKKSMYS